MSEVSGRAPVPPRVPTGIRGVDDVLGGGLFAGGVYIVMGMPGVGKTILGNQLAFHHARSGGRAVYVTLLSETHGRLLAFLQTMSFFDGSVLGDALRYLNGYTAVEAEGLPGLLRLVRQVVRESKASLLVVDGMMTAASIARSDVEYKKFVQELQSWIEVIGCTVVLVTSARPGELHAEYTMVDGIVELEYARAGGRRIRELTVLKFRGSAYVEGRHTYDITSDGIALYPRVEAVFGRRPRERLEEGSAGFAIPELDRMLGGGLARGSTAMVLGPTGTGKTMLGLQFVASGLAAGEPCVHLSFAEDPAATLAAGDALGLELSEQARAQKLTSMWYPVAEPSLDRIGHAIVSAVERSGARRVFVDGLEGLRDPSIAERLTSYWASLGQEMRAHGATLLASAEARHPLLGVPDPPAAGISALADTVLCLDRTRRAGSLIHVMFVPKVRGRSHERTLVEYEMTHRAVRILGRFEEDAATGTGRSARRKRRQSIRGGSRRKR
jgi:circadian clock protein KaiC